MNWKSDSWGLKRRAEDTFIPDDFRHEQYLKITEGDKRILISGCSHKGIVNITRHFSADILIGGFHLNKVKDSKVLEEIGQTLKSAGGVYYTGHCTGTDQFEVLKRIMGASVWNLSTGTVIQI